jgi:hypothetical protein
VVPIEEAYEFSTVRRDGSAHSIYFRHQPNLKLLIEQKGVQRLGKELESCRLSHVLLLLGEQACDAVELGDHI